MKGKPLLRNNIKTFKDDAGTLTIITNEIEKVLVKTFCSKCKKEGMAYEDPNSIIKKQHLCANCL